MNLKHDGVELIASFYNSTNEELPQEKLDSLFNRFYQDEKNMNYSAGAGIGLSLAKELVELHHGTIQVQGLTGGIDFIIHLPAMSLEAVNDEVSERVK